MSKPICSLLKFSFVFWLFSSTLFYPQTFAKKQTIFTGPEPYGIKAADVNKDGNQDLIWFSGGHNVEIHLGDGNGRFAATGPVYNTLLGAASEFEVADMDRDGHADIVAAGGHGIAVLRGNGDGTFQTPILFNIVSSSDPNDPAGTVDSLALGDFNKDGKLDALISIDSSIQIAFGKGDATFQSPAKVFPNGLDGFHFQFPGQLSNNAEAGDFDGDGNLDVAFYTCCDPAVSSGDLLFGGTLWAWYGDGTGNFPTKKAVQTDVPQARIKVFDINRDGKADILNVRQSCHDTCTYGVQTWLGHNTQTFTLYGAGVPNDIGATLQTGVAFGDFDHDGILDLVTGTGFLIPAGFLIFRRLPNNTIAGPVFRSVQTNEPLIDTEIASADFNHDGKPDLALTYAPDNRVVVMVNTTTPPGPCSDGPLYSLHLCSPGSGQTFVSGVHVSARANSDRTITSWKVYVDGVAKAIGTGANIEASITLGSFNFQRRITAKAWDASGASFSTSVLITVK